MEANQEPTLGHGKICYLKIPASDIQQSVAFYLSVFGWKNRRRGDGSVAFDDGVGQVSGTWVTGRKPSADPEVLIYIMVDDMKTTLKAVEANGGTVVQSSYPDTREIIARISDPVGNIFGLYQHPIAQT